MSTNSSLDMNTGSALQSATLVSNAEGNCVWNFPSPFTALPRVIFSLVSGDSALLDARITALSLAQVTVNVRRSAAVVVLGINVLGVPVAVAGVAVHFMAIAA